MTLRPLSQAAVIATFGDPWPYLRPDGSVGPDWEHDILTSIRLPAPLPLAWDRAVWVRTIRCHKRIARLLTSAFSDMYQDEATWKSINDFGGCYSWRPVRGSKELSRHAWGIAIDLDVRDNPFMGLVPRVNRNVRRIMERYGFAWGGATFWGGAFPWARRDAMHFEAANLDLVIAGSHG